MIKLVMVKDQVLALQIHQIQDHILRFLIHVEMESPIIIHKTDTLVAI